jgi:hypothetical protein
VLPPPVSARPGVSGVKVLVLKATGWVIDPIVGQVNHLRQAVIESLESLERDADDT